MSVYLSVLSVCMSCLFVWPVCLKVCLSNIFVCPIFLSYFPVCPIWRLVLSVCLSYLFVCPDCLTGLFFFYMFVFPICMFVLSLCLSFLMSVCCVRSVFSSDFLSVFFNCPLYDCWNHYFSLLRLLFDENYAFQIKVNYESRFDKNHEDLQKIEKEISSAARCRLEEKEKGTLLCFLLLKVVIE